MSDNAYKLGRSMVWSNAAGLYMRSFELARQGAESRLSAAAIGKRPVQSPESNLDRLYQMTGSASTFAHARRLVVRLKAFVSAFDWIGLG